MADSTILTPGCQGTEDTPSTVEETVQYLAKDNYLSEYENEAEKSVVRENLNVYPKNAVYTKDETDSNIATTVTTAINKHLSVEDPHGTLITVKEMITDMAKTDGSTPFISPQSGVEPVSDSHLTTKKFVTKLLNEHTRLVGSDDPHQILPEVQTILEKYVKSSDVYAKSQVYTKQEVDDLDKSFIKKDGTTPFTIAQIGVDPTIDGHLATKRYVDKTLYAHLVDVDPHGFLSILNQRLASYAKIADVYDKTQTYSRTQIDAFINKWVQEAVALSIAEYMETVDDRFESIRQDHYVKQDGSVPFRNPQAGVDAVEEEHLVTLRQLNEVNDKLQETIDDEITNLRPLWITSGPVRTTVGFVEDNTEPQKKVSFQEIMDAIFYGQAVQVTAPETCVIGYTVDVELTIHGLLTFATAELYQGDQLIGTYSPTDFVDGVRIVQSLPIFEDTTFTLKVILENGAEHIDKCITKVSQGIFLGLLPKWYTASNVTYQYLEELVTTDPTNNTFDPLPNNVYDMPHSYNFTTPEELKHLFVAIPKDYPDLVEIKTDAQSFGIDAFNVINDIPFKVPYVENDVIYKLYVYKQALAMYHSDVVFKFKTA